VQPVCPADLSAAANDRSRSRKAIYTVVFEEGDMVEPLESGQAFSLEGYYRRGKEGYRSIFDRYLGDLSVLVNCIYWDDRFPRLLTLDQCRRLWASRRPPKLKVIGDISCDGQRLGRMHRQGERAGKPGLRLRARAGKAKDGFEGHGPVIMAVDILPAEIPGNPPSISAGC